MDVLEAAVVGAVAAGGVGGGRRGEVYKTCSRLVGRAAEGGGGVGRGEKVGHKPLPLMTLRVARPGTWHLRNTRKQRTVSRNTRGRLAGRNTTQSC